MSTTWIIRNSFDKLQSNIWDERRLAVDSSLNSWTVHSAFGFLSGELDPGPAPVSVQLRRLIPGSPWPPFHSTCSNNLSSNTGLYLSITFFILHPLLLLFGWKWNTFFKKNWFWRQRINEKFIFLIFCFCAWNSYLGKTDIFLMRKYNFLIFLIFNQGEKNHRKIEKIKALKTREGNLKISILNYRVH